MSGREDVRGPIEIGIDDDERRGDIGMAELTIDSVRTSRLESGASFRGLALSARNGLSHARPSP